MMGKHRKSKDPTPEQKQAWNNYQKALAASKRRQQEVMDKLKEQMKEDK